MPLAVADRGDAVEGALDARPVVSCELAYPGDDKRDIVLVDFLAADDDFAAGEASLGRTAEVDDDLKQFAESRLLPQGFPDVGGEYVQESVQIVGYYLSQGLLTSLWWPGVPPAVSAYIQAGHRLAQAPGDLGDDRRLLIMRDGLNDGLGPGGGVARLEDAGADEDAVGAQLHHQRGVSGCGDAAGGEVDDGQLARSCDFDDQLERRAERPWPRRSALPSAVT